MPAYRQVRIIGDFPRTSGKNSILKKAHRSVTADYPKNLSWTCLQVVLARCLARRDEAAWSFPAMRSNNARHRARAACGYVADSPFR